MEELIKLIGKVSVEENTCTALQIYVDDRHIRSFIRGIVDQTFRKNMLDNHNEGMNYITFIKYEESDVIVFDIFYDWEIVHHGMRTTRYPIISSYILHDIISSPLFWKVIRETFPEPFILRTLQLGTSRTINVYW